MKPFIPQFDSASALSKPTRKIAAGLCKGRVGTPFTFLLSVILSVISLTILGCATPTNAIRTPSLQNGCLPDAIIMQRGLADAGLQARVLLIYWPGRQGHAITTYLYPGGANQLWYWDKQGSYRLRALWSDPFDQARAYSRLWNAPIPQTAEFY